MRWLDTAWFVTLFVTSPAWLSVIAWLIGHFAKNRGYFYSSLKNSIYFLAIVTSILDFLFLWGKGPAWDYIFHSTDAPEIWLVVLFTVVGGLTFSPLIKSGSALNVTDFVGIVIIVIVCMIIVSGILLLINLLLIEPFFELLRQVTTKD